jgi:hypothetical protein
MASKKVPPADAPLVVDRKTTPLWAMVDPADGTLYCASISSEIDDTPEGHDEVVLYTSERMAERACAAELLNGGPRLEACEVIVRRKR